MKVEAWPSLSNIKTPSANPSVTEIQSNSRCEKMNQSMSGENTTHIQANSGDKKNVEPKKDVQMKLILDPRAKKQG